MATNKGQLCRDLIGGSLQIKDSVVFDRHRNLKNVNHAKIDGNLRVAGETKLKSDLLLQGDAQIEGNLTVEGITSTVLEDQTGSSVYQKVVDATVNIYDTNLGTYCSGWIVSPDGWVATAAHCVLQDTTLESGIVDTSNVLITVLNVNGVEGDKRAFNPSTILVDGAADYALMKIDELTTQNFLEWGDITDERNGNRCYVVGNPLGFDQMSVASGIIRDTRFITDACVGGNYNATENLFVSVPTFRGNSGSPIINERCKVIGQLQWGPLNGADPAETIGGGTSVKYLKPVTEAMISSGLDYTQKGYLGFSPWWPMSAANAQGIGLDPSVTQLHGIVVNVNGDSPALTPVSGPALPQGNVFSECNSLGLFGEPTNEDMVVITEVDGIPVGNDKSHITAVTWFKTAGETVELKWYHPPSTTIQTTVVELDTFPAALDGYGGSNFSTREGMMTFRPLPPMTLPKSSDTVGVLRELASVSFETRDPLAATQHLSRLSAAAYDDGFSAPAGPTRPNPRTISNEIFAQALEVPNPDGLTDFFWLWGQFLDHDIDLSPDTSGESLNISVPAGDASFDPGSTGTVVIPMHRTDYDPATGTTNPREQLNHITSFIDATNVYGSFEDRVNWLRSGEKGKLKTSPGGLPPLNDGTQDNAVSPLGSAPFVVGDVRGNEQTLLLTMHTVLMREHNRWCDQLSAQYPSLSDEQLYQRARLMVESIVQHITWNEFLPLLLGADSLPVYSGYVPGTDVSIANEFSTAAFRLGHSLVSEVLWRLQSSGDQLPLGHLSLKDAFFAPHRFTNEGGMEPLIRGANEHICQKLDNKIVNGLRNFLFGPPGAGGLDLASLNIQRGREHGIADYNTVRVAIGLPAKASFAEMTSDVAVQNALDTAYGGDISLVDLWVGGLCEDHVAGSQLGETFHKIVLDQFVKLRDGDELWYETRLSDELLQHVRETKLSDVLRRNTNIAHDEIRDYVMKML